MILIMGQKYSIENECGIPKKRYIEILVKNNGIKNPLTGK